MAKMKGLPRSYCWWPNIDKKVEEMAKKCASCAETLKSPPKSSNHPWEWPSQPWTRIHVDFMGPWHGKVFLVMADAYSKWPEAFLMSSTSTTATIQVLRSVFVRNGLPITLVSDNGPQFSSEELAQFMQRNGIRHKTCAPYFPATNGLAERFVQTLKNALRGMEGEKKSLEEKLAEILMSYRVAPHAMTSRPPAELFLGRPL